MRSPSGCAALPNAKRRLVLSLAAVLLAPGSLAYSSNPRVSAVPGGVARVPLGGSESAPQARVQGRPVLVMREGQEWMALVGIALSAKPGSKLQLEAGRSKVTIVVTAKEYASQHLRVPQALATLPEEQLERYEREQAHLTGVLATFTNPPPAALQMLQPVPGTRSATFGLRRYFNGQARRPHNGMDIAAPEGTAVIAAGAGRVADTGDYIFSGHTIILDHGQGLLSLYAHLKSIHVAVDQIVAAGAPIGEVGSTGRATGPHLHFSVYLNAVAVDPAFFL